MPGLLFVGGVVFTGRDGEAPFSGGVATDGATIVAVGPDEDVRARSAPDARVIDLAGRAVLPGFVDAHDHLAFTGASLRHLDVRLPAVGSIAELVGRIAEAAERTPDGEWIRAYGMSDAAYPDDRRPTRWDLDEATRVHPVLVEHNSGHHALANSLALELRGLTDATSDPPGGHLIRDERGRLTGYCLDAAQQLVVPPGVDIGHHGPGFHDDATLEEVVADIARADEAYLAAGVTAVCDAQVTRRELAAYREAQQRGLLHVRVTCMPISSQLDALESLGIAGPFGDDRLGIGPMKFYSDGALTGGTAVFREPHGPARDRHGSYYWADEAAFQAAVARAHAAGWQVGIHSQGDAAIERSLDALEAAMAAAPRADPRHRIEHCGGVTQGQIGRMADLGIAAIDQPRYLHDAGDDFLVSYGPERAHRLQPLRTQLDRGVRTVVSTDAPVASHEPFPTIASAVARRTRSGAPIGSDEAIGVEEAIRAYTLDAAWSFFADGRIGSLEVGKLADAVIVDGDPFGAPIDRLEGMAATMTILDGEVVFERS